MVHGPAHARVVSALERAGSRTDGRGSWQCPAHDDRSPSLSVSNGGGHVLLNCHAGCDTGAVVERLGLAMRDLYDEPIETNTRAEIAATYDYVDENGVLLFQVVRRTGKKFSQRRPDGSGGWVGRLGGVRRVPYRLPEVIAARDAGDTIYIVEGEKDVETLRELDLVATTCSAGAGKWRPEYNEFFGSADVIVIADRDDPGRAHAASVRAALDGVARSVRVVQARAGKDVTDHVQAGHSVDELVDLDLDADVDGDAETEHEPEIPTLARLAYSGERLLALLERPRPAPIHAGVPVEGHLGLIVAPPFSGKSTLAYWSMISRAAGVAPWEGVPDPDSGRVLLVSCDEALEQVVRRLAGLAREHPAGGLVGCADRLSVIGPDRDIDPADLDVLRFDDRGLAALTEMLEAAIEQGDPFREVFLDAWADLIPVGETENSNELATHVGSALERLAVRTGAAITLLHHARRPQAGDTGGDLRFAGRGASALAAKARVISTIEAGPQPHLRMIRCVTNLGPAPRDQLLEVCPVTGDDREILYWRAHDPIAEHAIENLLAEGEKISTSELARRLDPREPEDSQSASGDSKRLAARLRAEWLRRGLIEVSEGPRRAKMLTRKAAEGSPS